ncbi:MAG TPA: DUF1778 domain-containing protein [Candidatus Sulfotelmatobacter sp.]|nr:DUF1778 domain-containing protein [Candidatus Sulfotelmatobacter sp.]
MAQKSAPSKRRRRRNVGYTYRVVGYLDRETHELVAKAAEQADENISTFVAKAVRERAETIVKKPHQG